MFKTVLVHIRLYRPNTESYLEIELYSYCDNYTKLHCEVEYDGWLIEEIWV